jgi:hypothetical protein
MRKLLHATLFNQMMRQGVPYSIPAPEQDKGFRRTKGKIFEASSEMRRNVPNLQDWERPSPFLQRCASIGRCLSSISLLF